MSTQSVLNPLKTKIQFHEKKDLLHCCMRFSLGHKGDDGQGNLTMILVRSIGIILLFRNSIKIIMISFPNSVNTRDIHGQTKLCHC